MKSPAIVCGAPSGPNGSVASVRTGSASSRVHGPAEFRPPVSSGRLYCLHGRDLHCAQMTGNAKSAKPESTASLSWHLATTDREAALSEFEWTLLRWHESYARFTRESLARASNTPLTPQEIMILHIIRIHDRPKTTRMIANLLNRTDIQNLQYSMRKLDRAEAGEQSEVWQGEVRCADRNACGTEAMRRPCRISSHDATGIFGESGGPAGASARGSQDCQHADRALRSGGARVRAAACELAESTRAEGLKDHAVRIGTCVAATRPDSS